MRSIVPFALAVLCLPSVLARAQAPPAAAPERPPLECPVPTGAAAAYDWTGLYDAGEGDAGPPPMVMTYKVYVFRESGGPWRAYSWVSGQTTDQQWALCGTAGERTLAFAGRNARPEADAEPEQPSRVFTLVRSSGPKFALRVEGGSYLLSQPSVDATRAPLPPWAGSYAYDSCEKAAATPCWRYAIDVSLHDDGWRALVSAGPADAPRRFRAQGEDYEVVTDGGRDVLALTQAGESLGQITRAKGGALTLELGALPAPPGRKTVPLTRTPSIEVPPPRSGTR